MIDRAQGDKSHTRSGEYFLTGGSFALLGILLFLAAAVRVWSAFRSGFWGDECLFLFVANLPTGGDLLNFLRLHESHPPLFYFLMRFWMSLFGMSDAALLALPVLCSMLTVAAVFVIGTRVFGRNAGMTAALLAALSPPLVEFGVLVRPYAFLQLFCLFSTYSLYKTLTENTWLVWGLYAVSVVVLLYTHNWSCIILMAQAVVYGLYLLTTAPAGIRRSRFQGLGVSLGLIVLFYSPWIPVVLYQSKYAGHTPVRYDVLASKIAGRLGMGGLGTPVLAVIGALAALAALSLLVSLVRSQKKNAPLSDADNDGTIVSRKAAYWLFVGMPLVAVAIAMVLSVRSDLLKVRCLVILFPCLLVAASSWLASAGEEHRNQRRIVAALRTGVLVCCIFLSLVGLRSLHKIVKSNARELAASLQGKIRPDDLILIAPEWYASSFNWYFKAKNDQIAYPYEARVEAMEYDHLLDLHKSPSFYRRVETRLQEARHAERRTWFITGADFHTDTSAQPSETINASNWYEAGFTRADQMYTLLKRLYGEPSNGPDSIPADNRRGAEIRAFLFVTSSPSPDKVAVTQWKTSDD